MTQLVVLYKLWRVWRRHPELRFGQFIEDVMHGNIVSLFYMHDVNLIRVAQIRSAEWRDRGKA